MSVVTEQEIALSFVRIKYLIQLYDTIRALPLFIEEAHLLENAIKEEVKVITGQPLASYRVPFSTV